MTKLASNFAPYAPPSNILKIIRDYRNGDFSWPTVLTESTIQGVGVPNSGIGRVMQTLEFLKLIDDNGKRTDQVDALDGASEDGFPAVLATILKQAYGNSLDCVDSENVDKVRVTNEFRRFKPERSRKRMVGLFLSLCEEARLAPKGTTRSRGSHNGSGTVRTPKKRRDVAPRIIVSDQSQIIHQAATASLPEEHWVVNSSNLIGDTIRRLPRGRAWSRDERNKWLKALEGNLDFEIAVVSEEATAS